MLLREVIGRSYGLSIMSDIGLPDVLYQMDCKCNAASLLEYGVVGTSKPKTSGKISPWVSLAELDAFSWTEICMVLISSCRNSEAKKTRRTLPDQQSVNTGGLNHSTLRFRMNKLGIERVGM